MGSASPNFDSGYGFVQAAAAFALLPKAAAPPPAAQPAAKSGGGGGLDVLMLLGLAGVSLARLLGLRRRVLI
jgi:predicted lipid-binding transport protein (Tim44 family)